MTSSAVLAFLGLMSAAAWIAFAVGRLPERGAWLITAVISALALLAAFAWDLLWPLPGAIGWLFGHAGHAWGRASRRVAPPVAGSDTFAPAPGARKLTLPAAAQTAPATLGRYRIDSEIGRGSMGAVYLGRDPQIGRAVAIKTMALSRGFGQDQIGEARERFFREAETAGRLHHPDIVTIFDAGESGDLAWIAMEYVRGEDLQRHAVPGRLLPVPQVLEIVARVAEALAYAHGQGVVHRDVKPANVMVGLDTGLVKVMDFGVARVDDASRTRTGVVLGTPSYMSPEQMAGRRTDGRSDLYSLGVMLFQLLTGSLPHEGENMAELMRRIVNDTAPDVRSLRPELPESLADVVALALEKRPEVRYVDGVQMAQDLRTVAATLAASTPSSSTTTDEFEKTVTFSRNDPRHNSAS